MNTNPCLWLLQGLIIDVSVGGNMSLFVWYIFHEQQSSHSLLSSDSQQTVSVAVLDSLSASDSSMVLRVMIPFLLIFKSGNSRHSPGLLLALPGHFNSNSIY